MNIFSEAMLALALVCVSKTFNILGLYESTNSFNSRLLIHRLQYFLKKQHLPYNCHDLVYRSEVINKVMPSVVIANYVLRAKLRCVYSVLYTSTTLGSL